MKRRSFISAAFSLAAAVSPLARSQEITFSYDVLVIGAGAAGLAAALEASAAGCRVLIVEQESFVGGDTLVSGGFYNSPDPELQSLINVQDSPEFYYSQILKSANGKGNPKLQKILANNAIDTLNWLKKHGVVFEKNVVEIYGSLHPRSHKPVSVSGTSYIQKLTEACYKNGVNFRTSTKFIEFVKDNGVIIGAIVENNKLRHKVEAKAIVLAAGGFGNNADMVRKYVPELKFVYSDSKGSGYVLNKAIEEGFKVENMNIIECVPEGSFLDQFSARIYVYVDGVLFVNESGERFVSENSNRTEISKALIAQGDQRCYTICGTENVSQMDKMLQKNLYRAYFSGQAWKADSLEKLFQTINIPFTHIENYIHEAPENKSIPRQAPFWAVRMYPWVHYTLGGLAINEQANCLNVDGEPIPNVFAAGQITGNIHGENRLGGNGLTDAFVFGRIAGKESAKVALRE